jgi:hypothetical protein
VAEHCRELVDTAVVDHLENEQRLLSGLDADEREQLATLLRKLLPSEPFRSLDPATEEPVRPRATRRRRRT